MTVIAVVGAGMMGSALCVPLADRGHDVRLVGTHLDGDVVEAMRRDGVHPKLGWKLPPAIRPFTHGELSGALADAEIVALGVSSAGIGWAADVLGPVLRPGTPVFMITKGLAWSGSELRVLPDVFRDRLPPAVGTGASPMAIGGPCIAGELARRVPTCVVLTGRDAIRLDAIARTIDTDYYHVTTSTDVLGVEVGAALKNAYAMGVAFATGLHERRGGTPGSIAMHNAESAAFAQSVREMRALARHIGATDEAAFDLAGIGDLDVTNNGGRTGRFGRLLGSGKSVQEAIDAMQGATLECLEILRTLREAAPHLGAQGLVVARDLPLLDHMMAVALDGAPVDLPMARFFGRGRS